MNLTVNYIPKNWAPGNYIAYMKWLRKIKHNEYSKLQGNAN